MIRKNFAARGLTEMLATKVECRFEFPDSETVLRELLPASQVVKVIAYCECEKHTMQKLN